MNIFTQKIIFSAEIFKFEQLFASEYDLKGFEIGELANDTSYEFKKVVKEELSSYEQNILDNIFSEKYCDQYGIGLLLKLMCKDGKIPEGDYILRSSW